MVRSRLLPPRRGWRRRREWLLAAAVCGGLLVAARSVRILDGPQVLVSALAAAGFGAIAAFGLRYFRPHTSLRTTTVVGAAVAAVAFGGWALTAGQ
ncbi:hypothetical protein BJ994_001796 [Arthrobacter pigmenti]|uniref:Uncharacterized protein n=1 Tax=Arthrobacter pigmenti TaxID=271432 RepID=A0A846RM78_9MICC|nr:hypothetical protein [Arthrobacter pigmenti]NJC22720.1 hypothetical protein [Arthrobacter pigmenti]